MAVDVADAIFYHINSTANLSTYDLLRRGQRVEVGKETNPFFRFYETYQRTYLVDSKTHMPALKFIREVRNGRVRLNDPAELPKIAFEVGNHFMMLARELVWENIRVTEFPNEPSRQTCMWLIPTVEGVRDWVSELNFAQFWVVKLRCTGRILHVDSRYLAEDSARLPEWYENARRYWRGEMSANPRHETLFEGVLDVEEIMDVEQFKKPPA